MATKRAPKVKKPKKEPSESTASGSSTTHAQPNRGSTGNALIKLQRELGNGAVARLIQREETSPEVRDVLLKESRSMMDMALAKVPTCLTLAQQMQTELVQTVPGVPPNSPMAQSLFTELGTAGSLLDSAIKMYEQAGGSLSDIEALLKVRAHLSCAMFYVQQLVANPSGGLQAQVIAHVTMAQTEVTNFKIAEALQAVEAQLGVSGPMTQEDSIQKQVMDEVLRVTLLVPFGTIAAVSV